MIEINTSKLQSAAQRASKTSEECENYGQALENKLIRKLRNYCGEKSSNINTATSNMNRKQRDVREKQFDFQQYSADIASFRSMVVSEENRLEGKIASLFGSFGNEHGITTEETWLERLGEILFGNAFGLIREIFFGVQCALKSVFDAVKDFYKYGGGKELLAAIMAIVIAIAAIVVAVVLTTVTGGGIWAVLASLASIALTVIAVANAVTSICNATGAIAAVAKGENHWAVRHLNNAESESFTDFLRKQGLFDVAKVIDGVEFVAGIINIASGGIKLFKNIKNAGGLINTFKGIGKKFSDLKNIKDVGSFKKYLSSSFDALKTTLGTKDGKKSFIKNVASITKDVADVSFDLIMGKDTSIGEKVIDYTINGLTNQKIQDGSKSSDFSLFKSISSLADKAVKTGDKGASLFNTPSVFDQGNGRNTGKLFSDASIPGTDISVGDFTSPGKFITGVTGSNTMRSVAQLQPTLLPMLGTGF